MITVKIGEIGEGTCALTSRGSDGLTVAFEDDTPLFLSWKSFKQLLSLRLAQRGKPPATSTNKPNATATEER